MAIAAVLLFADTNRPVHADNLFGGTWTIVRVDPAPWSDDKAFPVDRREAPAYVCTHVTFAADLIEGPELLAYARPAYEMKDFPAGAIFQGQLGDLEQRGGRKAEDSATAIGFATRPIRTLITGCMHSIDYHMSDANHAAFALNNMIYWLTRDGTP